MPYPFLRPAESPDELGRLGPYRVLKLLGQGGMGMVFCAEDPKLQRTVALKVLSPHLASDDSSHKRFLQEARAQAMIDHDHIISIHQVDEDNGIPYIAMPLLRGESLAARMAQGKLPLGDACRIAREIAEGLASAHRCGMVHRDIKPGNIWLEERPDGSTRVKILDFGLARIERPDATVSISDGHLVGTPAYMSPEQAQGEKATLHSDFFSLGCVLYEMCVGDRPFPGREPLLVLNAITNKDPEPPRARNPRVPAELSSLILDMLAKSPANRPQAASIIIERLRNIERGLADSRDLFTPTPAPIPQRVPAIRGKSLAYGAAALVTVVGVTLLAIASFSASQIFAPDEADGIVLPADEARKTAAETWSSLAHSPDLTWAGMKHRISIEKPKQVRDLLKGWADDFENFPRQPGNDGKWWVRPVAGKADDDSLGKTRSIGIAVRGRLTSWGKGAIDWSPPTKHTYPDIYYTSDALDYRPGDKLKITVWGKRPLIGRSPVLAEREIAGPVSMWVFATEPFVKGKAGLEVTFEVFNCPGPPAVRKAS